MVQLERSATDQDVKKAFRRLSLQFHPDKNSAPEAVPVFLKISQAYRALTGTLHIPCNDLAHSGGHFDSSLGAKAESQDLGLRMDSRGTLRTSLEGLVFAYSGKGCGGSQASSGGG